MNMEKGWDENQQFWFDVFNPMGYYDLVTDPTQEKMEEQAFHMAIKSGLLTTAATGVWALSGGGASMGMWFGAAPPTFKRMFFLKAEGYRAAGQFARQHLLRPALTAIRGITPYAIAYGAGYLLIDALHGVLDGPILPELHIDLY